MFYPGLVSISFREKSVDEIIKLLVDTKINYVEWGGDVHVPPNDIDLAVDVRKKCNLQGIICTSYGSYFRIGKDDPQSLPEILATAKSLKCECVRLWCGTKNFEDYTQEEKRYLINDAKIIASIAEKNLLPVCMECHSKTFTNSLEGALYLMESVNNPYFKMYWQPDSFKTFKDNLEYAKKIERYVSNIHVFNWIGKEKRPLHEAEKEWIEYLRVFNNDKNRAVLLEFMYDDDTKSLKNEYDTLLNIIKKL